MRPSLTGVALTGFDEHSFADACKEAGFGEFLLKPIAFEKLKGVIARLANQKYLVRNPSHTPRRQVLPDRLLTLLPTNCLEYVCILLGRRPESCHNHDMNIKTNENNAPATATIGREASRPAMEPGVAGGRRAARTARSH